jgi:glycosyltransferase involved in cell wall biosynthesis
MRPRIVYWNNIPAPYVVERFNALAERGTLDFEAWFSARTKQGRSWRVDESAWAFPYRVLPSINRGTYPLAVPTPLVTGEPPDLLITLYAAPAFLLGWALARGRGARTAFWVEVTYEPVVTRHRWKEALKSAVLPRADAILTPGKDGTAFAARYGVRHNRIFRVPHVIDDRRYQVGREMTSAARTRLRSELDVQGVTFIYVGRLMLGKGLMYLLEAFAKLQESHAGRAALVLVGDGPDEALIRERAKALSGNVVFTGFRGAEQLPQLYAAADVFVFPTLGDTFGLVVLEAMACGLPIISTSATGEIRDRVQEGVNGFIISPCSVEQLLDRMTVLVRDPERRRRMGEASIAKVSGQTPYLWAEAFEQAVEQILSMPRVRDRKPRA